jgi:thiamine monophosphate kinase
MPIIGNYKNALTWGDDYQLCFTLKATKVEQLYKIAKTHKIKISEIGKVKKGKAFQFFQRAKK